MLKARTFASASVAVARVCAGNCLNEDVRPIPAADKSDF